MCLPYPAGTESDHSLGYLLSRLLGSSVRPLRTSRATSVSFSYLKRTNKQTDKQTICIICQDGIFPEAVAFC